MCAHARKLSCKHLCTDDEWTHSHAHPLARPPAYTPWRALLGAGRDLRRRGGGGSQPRVGAPTRADDTRRTPLVPLRRRGGGGGDGGSELGVGVRTCDGDGRRLPSPLPLDWSSRRMAVSSSPRNTRRTSSSASGVSRACVRARVHVHSVCIRTACARMHARRVHVRVRCARVHMHGPRTHDWCARVCTAHMRACARARAHATPGSADRVF